MDSSNPIDVPSAAKVMHTAIIFTKRMLAVEEVDFILRRGESLRMFYRHSTLGFDLPSMVGLSVIVLYVNVSRKSGIKFENTRSSFQVSVRMTYTG